MRNTVLHMFCLAAAAALFAGLAGTVSVAEAFMISGRIVIVGGEPSAGATVWVDMFHTKTDSLGDYTIGGLWNEEYIVKVWAEHCLASVVDTVRISNGDLTGVNDTIVAADIVEDGRINLYDAGELLRHYGATPDGILWDEALDFDGSGVIDSLDTVVLMRCWKDRNDISPPSFMEVLEPNSATVWPVGQENVPIRWNTGNLAGPVGINLISGHDFIGRITSSTPNSGSYLDYDVPVGLAPGSEYSITVFHIDSGAYCLSEYFEVRQCIIVTEPASSTIWNAGQKGVPVNWITGNLSGYVSINLYRGTAFVRELNSGYVNNGTRLVDVPSDIPAGSDYRIQVRLSADYNDFSDCFSIRDTSFAVTMPDTNTAWLRGQQNVAIRWKSGSMTGNVSIGLYQGDNLVETIVPSTPNDGEYSEYVVPAGLTPGTDYRIRVDSDAGRYDLSEHFEIAKPSGWNWLYPSTGGYRLNAVCFADATVGTAVGEYGTILRTTDGGTTWVRQWGGTRKKLYGVDFLDANTGLAVGENGLILKTADGGATWASRESGAQGGAFYSVAFADADTAVAVGWASDGSFGLVFCRSTDGGETWSSSVTEYYTIPRSVSFLDAKIGAAAADGGRVYWTNDGGATWNIAAAWWGGDPNNKAKGISVLDAETWVLVGHESYMGMYGLAYRGVICRTRNAGATWARVYQNQNVLLNAISFADAMTGTVVGQGGAILKTIDGGATWTPQTSGCDSDLLGVSFADANAETAVGAYGRIVRTTDGGAAWTLQSPSTGGTLSDISFSNESEGMIVGGSGSSGVVLRTTDAGATWSSQSTSGGALSDISMANADTGTVIGSYFVPCVDCGGFPGSFYGVILRTTDGGATWVRQKSLSTLLSCVGFTDPNTGIVFAWSPTAGDSVFRTRDGGAIWAAEVFGLAISDVWFSDSNAGTAVGGSTILRTLDGGATWIHQTSGTSNGLVCVHFLDSNTGTVVGKGGTILRTVDGGATWSPQTSGTSWDLLGVRFVDANTGIAVGIDGMILRTTDGGATWTRQDSGTTNDLNAVYLMNANTAIVAGEGGAILKTTTGGE